MFQVTSKMNDRPAARRSCEATVARLLSQGRKPEIVSKVSKRGEAFIKVIDHSKRIYGRGVLAKKILGFEC